MGLLCYEPQPGSKSGGWSTDHRNGSTHAEWRHEIAGEIIILNMREIARAAEGWAIVWAVESVGVEVDDGLEARRVVRPLSDTGVGRHVEAAPMRNL